MLLVAALPALAPAVAPAATAADDQKIEEIVVTSARREQATLAVAGNIAPLDEASIGALGHQHIEQLLTRSPGVWMNRGSGQEYLLAIRSPVLTGSGSCGAFLALEDGIPTRPTGFCNVNQMFELFTEQARRIEVIRGPANALYGSNALHGLVNVLMPRVGTEPGAMLALEGGPNDFFRVRGLLDGGAATPALATFLYADDGGFRADSGYRQGKLYLTTERQSATDRLTGSFTATGLKQQTAGYIYGEDAYRDPSLNRGNVNPEAYRNASSQRLYGVWQREGERASLDVRPYLRHSDMEFLQHFLPGQPLEQNRQTSAGALVSWIFDAGEQSITTGFDVEIAAIGLQETQDGPTEGSDFLQETRPSGKHYDFDVQSTDLAIYLQAEFQAQQDLSISVGARVEYLHYNYDNRMLDGNTRDDGSACGFGGCLYSRPADRSDSFTNVAPKLAMNYRISTSTAVFASLARGFRAPQAVELYRLQSGQQIADLDTEILDNAEIGVRWDATAWSGEATAFTMLKTGSLYRDAEGYNVSGGRSRHRGFEFNTTWQIVDSLWLNASASLVRHTYDFDVTAALGETFISGNDIDTAPRWFGNAVVNYTPTAALTLGLQWLSVGDYFLDAENRFSYPGHELLNFRATFELTQQLSITARLYNLLDKDVADRADYAFGQYRYFPGRGRELFIELRYVHRKAR